MPKLLDISIRYGRFGEGSHFSAYSHPSFLAIGDPTLTQQISTYPQVGLLSDPQMLNSYSYASNNPITKKDPSGNAVADPITAFLTTVFIPTAVGDPVFNSNGTVSPTSQQASIDNVAFIGAFVSPSGEAKVTPQILGKAGEIASGAVPDIKQSIEVNGRIRITDILQKASETTNGIIGEVKKTKVQALTQQLRDNIQYAAVNNSDNLLYLNEATKITAPLQQAIKNGQVTPLSLIIGVVTATVKALLGK